MNEIIVTTGLPFDDIRDLIKKMPSADQAAINAVKMRQSHLAKPPGALGRLEDLVEWLAGWQGSSQPHLDNPMVAVFAGNHGINARGVSAWPSSVTQKVMETMGNGGAAINQMCITFNLGLKLFDLALELPTADFTVESALDEVGCAATIAFGMEAVSGEIDLLILGDLGIANTTSASAIYHALYGGRAHIWVGQGAGADEGQIARKLATVEAGIKQHAAHLNDPLEILRRLGGREISAIMGAILAARIQRIPVILDGFVVCAAAAILHAVDPKALDHCIAAHKSSEQAHGLVLDRLKLKPILDLNMRLGEGTGAALAFPILKAALACWKGMATFEEAGIKP